MSNYNSKNYTEQGGDILHIGGSLIFDEGAVVKGFPAAENLQPKSTNTAADIRNDLNALILGLKKAGLVEGDPFILTVNHSVNDSEQVNADRQYNTGKITSVTESNGVITITLSEKVTELKDFDGLNGWGIHKWLGIGVSAGITPLTDLTYNGEKLTEADVAEATTQCGLDAGFFVRWVAADLVLKGESNAFTLYADGYKETTYRIEIVEPEE